jgi:NagD protein
MPLLPKDTETRLRDAALFLLDLDGTIYRGSCLIAGAKEFIENLRSRDIGYIFLTNNSSRTAEEYRLTLETRGIPANPENIFTSGQATGLFLAEKKPQARVFCAGTAALSRELSSYGLQIVECGPQATESDVDFVVVGFDTELTYEKLRIACALIDRGVEYIATNPDYVCPIENGRSIPDCGSICFMIEQATGKKPYVIGKPNPAMVQAAADRLGIPMQRTVLIGDRLYTDIAAGVAAGALSICVLSGESTREDIRRSPFKPDAVIESIDTLNKIFSDPV